MDISRAEQRILHLMAQGGWIEIIRDDNSKKITEISCFTREGWRFPDLSVMLFRKLKSKRAIASSNSKPYRITRKGLELVRSQLDNQ